MTGVKNLSSRYPKIEHVEGTGFHSARRKFVSELQGTNHRDLLHLGGWKWWHTLVTCYQQPEIEVQREALATRKKLRVAG